MGTSVVVSDVPQPDWDEPRFQRWVVATARANGWLVRIMDQRGRPGWRGQASDKGWPDLLLVRDRVVWLELKARDGTLREDQKVVLAALQAAAAEVYVVDPSSWESLLRSVL